MATLARMRLVIDVVRSVVAIVAGILATIVVVATVIVVSWFDETSPLIDRAVRTWARVWLFASGTRLEVEGRQNIDPDRSYVVVSNHLSALDIMACQVAVPLPIRFLAKKELFKVPVLAQGMRAIGIVEVDRTGRAAVHAEINRQSRELIAKGRSLLVFAEGTRPRDGVMQPFKKGAFTMAIGSELPVLPVAIHGSDRAWPPETKLLRGGTIRLAIEKPIESEGMGRSDAGSLRDQVREVIADRVIEMGGGVSPV